MEGWMDHVHKYICAGQAAIQVATNDMLTRTAHQLVNQTYLRMYVRAP